MLFEKCLRLKFCHYILNSAEMQYIISYNFVRIRGNERFIEFPMALLRSHILWGRGIPGCLFCGASCAAVI